MSDRCATPGCGHTREHHGYGWCFAAADTNPGDWRWCPCPAYQPPVGEQRSASSMGAAARPTGPEATA